jgi:GMP synthase-like glutamine amidotransferase
MDVKVDRSDKGWEVSVVKVDLTAKGKELLGIEDLVCIMKDNHHEIIKADSEQHIHQMHRDIVYAYPDDVEHLGHTDRCEVQGMYQKNRLMTVQGHPEFNGDVVSELLQRRHDQGIFDDAMYDEGMSRVRKHHDGTIVGAAFLRFLLEK